jgi:hypothetical protein
VFLNGVGGEAENEADFDVRFSHDEPVDPPSRCYGVTGSAGVEPPSQGFGEPGTTARQGGRMAIAVVVKRGFADTVR